MSDELEYYHVNFMITDQDNKISTANLYYSLFYAVVLSLIYPKMTSAVDLCLCKLLPFLVFFNSHLFKYSAAEDAFLLSELGPDIRLEVHLTKATSEV